MCVWCVCVCMYHRTNEYVSTCVSLWMGICVYIVCTITLHRVLYPFLAFSSNRNMYIYICIYIGIIEKKFRYDLPSAGRRSNAGYTYVTDGIAVVSRVWLGGIYAFLLFFSFPPSLPSSPPLPLFFSLRYPFFRLLLFPPCSASRRSRGLPGGKGRVRRLGAATVFRATVSRFLRNVPRPVHARTHTRQRRRCISAFTSFSSGNGSRVRFHSRRATKSCTISGSLSVSADRVMS